MLKVENLKTGFPNKTVIDDVSFEIKKPGLVGLIGPNGCGKSTLLKSIAGVQPFDGTIHFAGKPLKSYPLSQRVHALSYVAQKSGQRVTLTVREVVQLGRDAGRMPFQRHSLTTQKLLIARYFIAAWKTFLICGCMSFLAGRFNASWLHGQWHSKQT